MNTWEKVEATLEEMSKEDGSLHFKDFQKDFRERMKAKLDDEGDGESRPS